MEISFEGLIIYLAGWILTTIAAYAVGRNHGERDEFDFPVDVPESYKSDKQ